MPITVRFKLPAQCEPRLRSQIKQLSSTLRKGPVSHTIDVPRTLEMESDWERALSLSEVRCHSCGTIAQLEPSKLAAIAKTSADQINQLVVRGKKSAAMSLMRSLAIRSRSTWLGLRVHEWRRAAREYRVWYRTDMEKNNELLGVVQEARLLAGIETMRQSLRRLHSTSVYSALCTIKANFYQARKAAMRDPRLMTSGVRLLRGVFRRFDVGLTLRSIASWRQETAVSRKHSQCVKLSGSELSSAKVEDTTKLKEAPNEAPRLRSNMLSAGGEDMTKLLDQLAGEVQQADKKLSLRIMAYVVRRMESSALTQRLNSWKLNKFSHDQVLSSLDSQPDAVLSPLQANAETALQLQDIADAQRKTGLRMLRAIMRRLKNRVYVVLLTNWRAQTAEALAQRAASNAAADALREAGQQDKKALKQAEAEAARIKELLKNASGEEAVELAARLQEAEDATAAAQKRTAEKIMNFVGKRWRMAGAARVLTMWKLLLAQWVQEQKAAEAAAQAYVDEVRGVQSAQRESTFLVLNKILLSVRTSRKQGCVSTFRQSFLAHRLSARSEVVRQAAIRAMGRTMIQMQLGSVRESFLVMKGVFGDYKHESNGREAAVRAMSRSLLRFQRLQMLQYALDIRMNFHAHRLQVIVSNHKNTLDGFHNALNHSKSKLSLMNVNHCVSLMKCCSWQREAVYLRSMLRWSCAHTKDTLQTTSEELHFSKKLHSLVLLGHIRQMCTPDPKASLLSSWKLRFSQKSKAETKETRHKVGLTLFCRQLNGIRTRLISRSVGAWAKSYRFARSLKATMRHFREALGPLISQQKQRSLIRWCQNLQRDSASSRITGISAQLLRKIKNRLVQRESQKMLYSWLYNWRESKKQMVKHKLGIRELGAILDTWAKAGYRGTVFVWSAKVRLEKRKDQIAQRHGLKFSNHCIKVDSTPLAN